MAKWTTYIYKEIYTNLNGTFFLALIRSGVIAFAWIIFVECVGNKKKVQIMEQKVNHNLQMSKPKKKN